MTTRTRALGCDFGASPPTPRMTRSAIPRTALTPPPRWMRWAPQVAALWSAAYLAMGILWLTGRGSYPWARDAGDTSGIILLGRVEPRIVAWMVIGTAALGLAATGTMFTLARRPGQGLGLLRVTALLSALMGIVLSVVVPDFRVLRTVAYLPVLIVMTILGMDTGALWATAFALPVVNLMILTLGGVAFLAAAAGQFAARDIRLPAMRAR